MLEQTHAGFLWQTIALLTVASDAGNDDVLPRRASPAVTGNDVVHIQVLGWKILAAVLTLVFVSLKEVLPVEFHFLHQHPVVVAQKQDARHNDFLTHRPHDPGTWFVLHIPAMSKPRFPVEHPETAILGKDHLGVIKSEQTKSPFDPNYVDRLPEAVEHECLVTGVHPD